MVTTDRTRRSAVVQATSVPIHDIGTAIYLSPDVCGWAAEWGWSNPFAFYFAGRGGMLGDVGPDVVDVGLRLVRAQARCTPCTPKARRGRCHDGGRAGWPRPMGCGARSTTATCDGIDDIVAVTEELVDGLEGSAIPLFVGWRDAARSSTPAGRAAQLMQILREWRGGHPPGRHHRRRPVAARSHPDQRGRGPGQVLRLARALPRLSPPSRSKHDEAEDIDRPPLRLGPGRCPRPRPTYADFEAGVAAAARRHPVSLEPASRPGRHRTRDRLE